MRRALFESGVDPFAVGTRTRVGEAFLEYELGYMVAA